MSRVNEPQRDAGAADDWQNPAAGVTPDETPGKPIRMDPTRVNVLLNNIKIRSLKAAASVASKNGDLKCEALVKTTTARIVELAFLIKEAEAMVKDLYCLHAVAAQRLDLGTTCNVLCKWKKFNFYGFHIFMDVGFQKSKICLYIH